MRQSSQSVELPRLTRIMRPVIRHLWQKKYPIEVVSGQEHFEEANDLLNLGYGMVYMMNHFSLGDTQRGFQLVLKLEAARKRFIGGPMAHVHRTKLNAFLAKTAAGIQTYEVVSPYHAKEFIRTHSKAQAKKLGQDYLDQATQLLLGGGIIGLAPQSTRKPVLGKPKFPVVQSIIDAITPPEKSQRMTSVWPAVFFWCVGLKIDGIGDYGSTDITQKNKGVTYQARVGKPQRFQDILKQMSEQAVTADQLIFSELEDLVPQAYLG